MTTGFGAVKAAMDTAKQQSAASGSYLPSIYWKNDEEKKIVRFLPAVNEDGTVNRDGVVHTRDFYDFLITNDGRSKRDFIKPLEGEDWIGENIVTYDKNGNVVPVRARTITVGLAVTRTETATIVNGKRKSTYSDEIRTYEKDGKTVSVENYGVIKQGNKNFYSLLMAYWNKNGTICDRDFEITRNGKGLDTTYSIIACDVDEDLDTDEKVAAKYSPPITLAAWVAEQESPERVEQLLKDPAEGVNARPDVQPGFGGAGAKAAPAPAQQQSAPASGSPAQAPESAPAGANTTDDFDALRAELLGG